MASEKVAGILAEMRTDYAFALRFLGEKVGGYINRIEAAHKREMEVLRRRLDAVVESRKTTCGLCPSSGKIKELERKAREANLQYLAEKARHTDTYKDERIKAQDAEIGTLKREVAELCEYLKEAIAEQCRSCKAEWYGKCPSKDGGDCELIAKWRKALEGELER